VIWAGASNTVAGETPFSSAATMKNILNADPGWKPVPPCPVARLTCDFLKSRPP
jgi:hypothetical protein